MNITVRPAVENDAEGISRLISGWVHHYLDDPAPPEAAPFLESLAPESTAERIASREFDYHVAVDDKGICGVIAIRENFHLYHLFVRSDSHGNGVARRLWQHAKSQSGSGTFVVNSSLPAVPVYRRFGFRTKGGPRSAKGLTFVPMEYSDTADASCMDSSRK